MMERSGFLRLVAVATGSIALAGLPACRAAGGADVAGDGHSLVRAPGEHEPQAMTVMAWPQSLAIWGKLLAGVQREIAMIASVIADRQPVLMVVPQARAMEAERALDGSGELLIAPVNDCWIGDTGPMVVIDRDQRVGLDFVFNGWGGKVAPVGADDRLPSSICRHLGMERRPIDMVLEGRSVIVDGEGTLITTEDCLLNPNRNPSMTKAEIELALRQAFGVEVVIWLPFGLRGDRSRNGHVDGVARFVRPGTLMIQVTDDATPDAGRLARNREVLGGARDALGRPFDLIEMPLYPTLPIGDTKHSYLRFAVLNRDVLVPTGGCSEDDEAISIMQAAFPDRRVLGMWGSLLSQAGGGIHAATQHIPAEPGALRA